MSLTSSELDVVKSAVIAAGDELLKLWPGAGVQGELGVETKQDGSLVSRADYAANKILVEKLQRSFPDYSIHSEEGFAEPGSWGRAPVWILDPLDGTTLFLNGGSEFAVLVSLVDRGSVLAGFMYFPVLNEMYLATRSGGAFLNGQKIERRELNLLLPKRIATRKSKLRNPELEYSSGLNTQVAFRELLNGRLQGVIFLTGTLGEWDLAAPSVIVEESGGKFTDWSGAVLDYQPGALPHGFAVSLGVEHAEILRQIED